MNRLAVVSSLNGHFNQRKSLLSNTRAETPSYANTDNPGALSTGPGSTDLTCVSSLQGKQAPEEWMQVYA